jgi:hypothetical protein
METTEEKIKAAKDWVKSERSILKERLDLIQMMEKSLNEKDYNHYNMCAEEYCSYLNKS